MMVVRCKAILSFLKSFYHRINIFLAGLLWLQLAWVVDWWAGVKIIRDCNSELQDCAIKFRKHASAIAEWDKRIIQNRNVLIRLEVCVFIYYKFLAVCYIV